MDWEAKLAWAHAEHGRRRGAPAAAGERADLRLAGVAGASWAAGLAALMLGREPEAALLLRQAAAEYRVSWEAAPQGSWGRPIAAMRCRLIAGDGDGACADARWALDAGALPAEGPIQRYAAVLALTVLGDDRASAEAASLLAAGLEPRAVAEALVAITAGDVAGYHAAVARVLGSFEEREAFLEDVAVADTVLVLDAIARLRGLPPAGLSSPLLPRPAAEA